jgi:hypothetical protein
LSTNRDACVSICLGNRILKNDDFAAAIVDLGGTSGIRAKIKACLIDAPNN